MGDICEGYRCDGFFIQSNGIIRDKEMHILCRLSDIESLMLELEALKGTDKGLLRELILRNGYQDAPIKTSYGDGMKVCDVAFNDDETATIAFHIDALNL